MVDKQKLKENSGGIVIITLEMSCGFCNNQSSRITAACFITKPQTPIKVFSPAITCVPTGVKINRQM